MKSKNGNVLPGVFITVFVIIVVGVIILWMTGVIGNYKTFANKGDEKIKGAVSEMSEDLKEYEDRTILGSDLKQLIVDLSDKNASFTIEVKTLANPTGKGYTTTSTPSFETDKSEEDYINPNAWFKGVIDKNANNEIIGMIFTQQP